LLVLASCSGRETALSPAEYYDFGRYARLEGDWNAAVGYFEKALSVAERIGDNYYRGYASQQLAAIWAQTDEYSKALVYSMNAVSALNACGEEMGAFLSHVNVAYCCLALGNRAGALKILNELKAAYPDAAPLLASILTSLEVTLVNNVY
jgi:tetratricopeptide (TPR) repeat protein